MLADLKTKRPKPEPVKPKLLTEKEYRIARGQPGVAILKNVSPNQAGERVLIYYKMIENVRAIMPRSARCVEREGWKQLLDKHPTEQQLDQLVDFRPHLRPLKDRELQKLLRARAGWVEREELFKQLHTITGDERDWSLLHPFDDLDRDSMLRVIRAAGKAKDKGYSVLSKEELDLLLRADQLEFLDTLLAPPPSVHVMMPSTTPEERRAEEEFKERKRKAAEAAALEQHKKEREEDKKREAVRQRQMKIDKEEKEANKLLRAALLLDGRGGFEKQVRQRLQEIIDKYPDTPSAQKAQRQLDKMAK